jgi:hypothetical protein
MYIGITDIGRLSSWLYIGGNFSPCTYLHHHENSYWRYFLGQRPLVGLLLLASPNGLLLLISMVVFSKKKNVYVSLRIKLRTRIRLGVSLPSFDTIAQNGVLCVSWKAIDPWRNLAWARFAPGCPKWDSMYSMYPLLHKLMLRRSYLHKYVFGSIELCKNMFWWWMCNFVKHLFALA